MMSRCSCARLALIALAIAAAAPAGCAPRQRPGDAEVVVYTSVDQVYAKDVFDLFEKETGIQVREVFDTEAAKTTGLYQRLLSEGRRPRADVFWNNEITRTIQLADARLAADLSAEVPDDIPREWLDDAGRWAAFSLRARVIVYNTEMVQAAGAPRRLAELTTEKWRGKVAIANPLFGTTAAHVAALYEVLGETQAERFLAGLKANDARIMEGNSAVRDAVGRGQVPVGLTDSDDFFAGLLEGQPLAVVLPDQDGPGTLVIPNSVMIVEGGPHPVQARRFVRFLLRLDVEEHLAFAPARQIPVRDHARRPADLEQFDGIRGMTVDYRALARRMPATAQRVEEILLK
ncbi:MAG: extracellular solute-binding protein [Planctomycetota bacterium]